MDKRQEAPRAVPAVMAGLPRDGAAGDGFMDAEALWREAGRLEDERPGMARASVAGPDTARLLPGIEELQIEVVVDGAEIRIAIGPFILAFPFDHELAPVEIEALLPALIIKAGDCFLASMLDVITGQAGSISGTKMPTCAAEITPAMAAEMDPHELHRLGYSGPVGDGSVIFISGNEPVSRDLVATAPLAKVSADFSDAKAALDAALARQGGPSVAVSPPSEAAAVPNPTIPVERLTARVRQIWQRLNLPLREATPCILPERMVALIQQIEAVPGEGDFEDNLESITQIFHQLGRYYSNWPEAYILGPRRISSLWQQARFGEQAMQPFRVVLNMLNDHPVIARSIFDLALEMLGQLSNAKFSREGIDLSSIKISSRPEGGNSRIIVSWGEEEPPSNPPRRIEFISL